ncbi:hypothetical protein F5884DRAFT_832255 [Xylogone sp. PMI_703]|nr:hypothetical protein F5884DRAFT_832255 [Xylogone sp. PMI_703]
MNSQQHSHTIKSEENGRVGKQTTPDLAEASRFQIFGDTFNNTQHLVLPQSMDTEQPTLHAMQYNIPTSQQSETSLATCHTQHCHSNGIPTAGPADAMVHYSDELFFKTYQPYNPYPIHTVTYTENHNTIDCPYHSQVLQGSSTQGTCGYGKDPMTRWQMIDSYDECSIVCRQDGELSIHKDCQCKEMVHWDDGTATKSNSQSQPQV